MFVVDAGAELRPMLEYLDLYLADPRWSHAVQVVPFLAKLDGRSALPFWDDGFESDAGLVGHLVWSLDQWSAFRGEGTLESKRRTLEARLPSLIRSIQQAAPASRLFGVPVEKLVPFAAAVTAALDVFDVKANGSYVLPSKTAHLLLPTLIPAYDGAVVEQCVLATVFPRRTRGAKTYATWLRLCWWALKRFHAEGTLAEAQSRVFNKLMGDWRIRALGATRPAATSFIASALDSYVAEYAMIGMYYDLEAKAGPTWKEWRPPLTIGGIG